MADTKLNWKGKRPKPNQSGAARLWGNRQGSWIKQFSCGLQ